MAIDDTLREHAIAWAVRTGDPAFEDWDAFTRWLEEDPAHSAAYDEVMVTVGEAADVLPAIPQPGNDDEAVRAPRRRIGGAVAVALAVVAALGVWQMRGGSYTVETAPGEMRLVELDGGGQIAVSGDTRLVLDRNDPRLASLERGQALFTIEHDAARPFRLKVGEDTLVDVGTVFDVEHADGHMTVAVSEGAVVFNPEGQNVHLAPGQMLSSDTGSDSYRVAPIAVSQVGEWREGRLTFEDATLGEVAADLTRATGTAFTVSPGSAGRRVSGSLLLDPVRKDPRTLGALLGVGVRYNGQAWEIGAR